MAYLDLNTLKKMNFKYLGNNVKISERAAIYDPEKISIGNNSRIDDFCILSGVIEIGINTHLTPMCLIAGGAPGVYMDDFCTLAYGVKIFSQSDDYSGETLVNSTIPKKFKKEIYKPVSVGKNVIIGAGSIVMPGCDVADGCAIGAMTLLTKPTQPWGVYAGVPAKRINERSKKMLELEKLFLKEEK